MRRRTLQELYDVRRAQRGGAPEWRAVDDAAPWSTTTTTTTTTYPDGRVEVRTVTAPPVPDDDAVERCVLHPYRRCADVLPGTTGWCDVCLRDFLSHRAVARCVPTTCVIPPVVCTAPDAPCRPLRCDAPSQHPAVGGYSTRAATSE